MSEYRICKTCADIIKTIAVRVNGGQVVPGAITVGPDTFYLEEPSMAMRRHENVHREQEARREPTWLPTWGPLGYVRRTVGTGRFLRDYLEMYRKVGYANHPLEVEARAAE